jgi:hypothetical protein
MNSLQVNVQDQAVVFRAEVFHPAYRALPCRVWKVLAGYGATPVAQGHLVQCRSLLDGQEAQFDALAIERLATANDLAVVAAARQAH